ncbi:non-specific serine/threonine protein kinase [Entamoeba marina]
MTCTNTSWGKLQSLQETHPSVLLKYKKTEIGRNNKEFYIKTNTISNIHCFVELRTINSDETYILKDVSTNGTYVNNKRIKKNDEIILFPLDTIMLLGREYKESLSYLFIPSNFWEKEVLNGAPFEKYEIKDFIGVGSFGVVLKIVEVETQKIYAMKFIRLPKSSAIEANRESDLLKKVHHRNVVEFHDFYQTKASTYIIMEYISGGDLRDVMKRKGSLKESTIRIVMRQVLEALRYLHEEGVIHRDLKSENVMVFDEGKWVIKLTDFGFGRFISETKRAETRCGTMAYAAPELFSGKSYDGTMVDIWSAGVLMYYLATSNHPFYDNKAKKPEDEMIQNILNGKRMPNPTFDSNSLYFRDIINNMLVVNPNYRFDAKKCIEHEFFSHGVSPRKGNSPHPKKSV